MLAPCMSFVFASDIDSDADGYDRFVWKGEAFEDTAGFIPSMLVDVTRWFVCRDTRLSPLLQRGKPRRTFGFIATMN